MEISEAFKDIKSFDVDDLLQYITENFLPKIHQDFLKAFNMMNDLGNLIAISDGTIPAIYIESADIHASQFYKELRSLKRSVGEDSNRVSLEINQFNLYIETLLLGKVGNIEYRFIDIFSAINSLKGTIYSFESIENVTSKLTQQLKVVASAQDDYEKKMESLVDLSVSIEQEGKKLVAERYADIFVEEAKLHSGNSVKWLSTALFFILVLLAVIYFEDSLLPIKKDEIRPTVLTLEYLRRLLILSFNIYIITFCLKQYNIKKHLETLNRHRSNTLSSFKLFINSMNSSNEMITITLMQEVARAIYESGQTGYVNLKDDSNATNSVTEITKLFKVNEA